MVRIVTWCSAVRRTVVLTSIFLCFLGSLPAAAQLQPRRDLGFPLNLWLGGGGAVGYPPAAAMPNTPMPFGILSQFDPATMYLAPRILRQLAILNVARYDAEVGRWRGIAMQELAEGIAAMSEARVKWFESLLKVHHLRRKLLEARIDTYLEKQQKFREAYRKRAQNPQTLVPSETEANYLLAELAPTIMSAMTLGDTTPIQMAERITFTDDELRHIRVADSQYKSRGRVEWTLQGGEVMSLQWPVLLRDKQFEPLRREIETLRDKMLRELQEDGSVRKETYDAMLAALDRLDRAITEVFPLYKDQPLGPEQLARVHARQFVRLLKFGTVRLASLRDTSVLRLAGSFKGNTLADILKYMVSHGLVFAAPKPGDEAAYRKLIDALRRVYLSL